MGTGTDADADAGESTAASSGYTVAMPRIRVLADAVVNRIAAGEVVERPSSVVKELLENALDAGAERVEVELERGGCALVRVTDDGCGMDPDDALLALERHATSKLAEASDLEHIATLGFRGEALPSIAAVSRFELHTAVDPAAGGVRVTVEGGRVLDVSPAARPRGTTVTVRDLFFNTPARRKFLHAPETELRHAQEAVQAAAVARPEVVFRLRHGGRTLVETVATADPSERVRQLWPRTERVIRFAEASSAAAVEGWLAPSGGSGKPKLVLLVNQRPVRDRLVMGAVWRVLREAGGGFGGARVVLDIRVPPDAVDVNVHPTKAEVRFARGGAVFGAVERALRGGITASQGRVEVRRMDELDGAAAPARVGEASAGGYGAVVAERTHHVAPLFDHPAYGPGAAAVASTPPPVAAEPALADVGDPWPRAAPRPRAGARPGTPDTPFGRLIGQYRSSFLLLEDDWGLVIVDQHVAHERVLYDRIRRQLDGEAAPSQRLLEPLLLELDAARAGALDGVAGLLAAVGVEADLFGPETVRVAALPPELDAAEAAALVEVLLDRATSLDGVPETAAGRLADQLAADLSCRAAVKVNHVLGEAEQRRLLADLVTTSNPYRCPHGRPIVLRLSQEEMERRLGRR